MIKASEEALPYLRFTNERKSESVMRDIPIMSIALAGMIDRARALNLFPRDISTCQIVQLTFLISSALT